MKKKKNENDIGQPSTLSSRTITRSGIIENEKELVVACGYTVGGQFGYFVCWERQEPRNDNKVMHEYSGTVLFKKKANDRTLYDVLADFKTFIDSRKNK